MPNINLLPWRAELRKRRNKEFGMSAFVVVAAMAGVVAGVNWYFQQRIDFQKERNEYLNVQIVSLDKKTAQIEELDREKDRLIERTRIIQDLQSSRPEIVRVVDAIVEALPAGVFYTSIAQSGRLFKVLGVAQSNARVSTLMRQLESSDLFENPTLVEITAAQKAVASGSVKLSNFSLTVGQSKKKKAEDAKAGGDKKS